MRHQRVTRGELVEEGDLVGQRCKALGAIAAEILPEALGDDRQELDGVGTDAQEIGQCAVEQKSNACLADSRVSCLGTRPGARGSGAADAGLESGLHAAPVRCASWWRGRS